MIRPLGYYYGWYSAKQAVHGRSVVWKNAQGWPVVVTCVSDDLNHCSGWDDMKMVGIVVEYMRPNTNSHARGRT